MNIKQGAAEGLQKAKTMITNVGKYWNQPKEGEYVSYKEFSKFVLGSIGSCMAGSAGGQLGFNATCLFVGAVSNIVGIIPYHFYDLTEDKHRHIIEELKKRVQLKESDNENGEPAVSETETKMPAVQ